MVTESYLEAKRNPSGGHGCREVLVICLSKGRWLSCLGISPIPDCIEEMRRKKSWDGVVAQAAPYANQFQGCKAYGLAGRCRCRVCKEEMSLCRGRIQ